METVTVAGQSLNKPVFRVRIDLTAKAQNRQEIIAAGHLGAPGLRQFPLFVLADLRASVNQAGEVVLSILPVDVGSGGLELKPEVKEDLKSQMPTVAKELALPKIAGIAMKAHNAGLMSHADGVVALLIEMFAGSSSPGVITAIAATPSSLSTWKSFFAGEFTAHKGTDWSILVPAELLVTAVDSVLDSAIGDLTKDPEIDLVSSPSTWWEKGGPPPGLGGPPGGQVVPIEPHVASVATINAVDGCKIEIVGEKIKILDIEVDLNFSVFFSSVDGKLQIDVKLSWDASDWDVLKCAGALVLVLGGAGTLGAGLAFGPVGAVVAAILTLVALIVALLMISDKIGNKVIEGAGDIEPGDLGLHVVEKDDDHVVIRGSAPLDLGLPGLQTPSIKATEEGLLISGALSIPEHQERSLKVIGETPFGWDARYSCSSYSWVEERLSATVAMVDPANVPVEAKAEVLTKPAKIYPTYTTDFDPWSVPAPGGGFFSPGFVLKVESHFPPGSQLDCELLIRTNSGIRYANFGWLPKPPTKPDAQELAKMKPNCFKPVLPGPKQWLEVQWLVDPPPFEPAIKRLRVWDLKVIGVPPGERVELGLSSGRGQPRVIHALRADDRRVVAFKMTTSDQEHLVLGVDGKSDEVRLFAAGAHLEPIAAINPFGPPVGATVIGVGPAARVAVAAGGWIFLWDVEGRFRGSIDIPGVRDVRSVAQGDLVAYTDTSVMRLGMAGDSLQLLGDRTVSEGIAEVSESQEGVTVKTGAGGDVFLDRILVPVHARDTGHPRKPAISWNAEPWLNTPMRPNRLVAVTSKESVVIYRYSRRAIF